MIINILAVIGALTIAWIGLVIGCIVWMMKHERDD